MITDLQEEYYQLHEDLKSLQNIKICESTFDCKKIQAEKYLQHINDKWDTIVPDEYMAPFACTYGNTMTYHFYVGDEVAVEGSWNYRSPVNSSEFDELWLKHEIENVERKLIVFDRPNVAMQFGCFLDQGNHLEELKKVYFYKMGELVETSMNFQEYVKNQVQFMGVLYWPLLFTESPTKQFNYEITKLKKALPILEAAFPNRDFSLYKEKLSELGNV